MILTCYIQANLLKKLNKHVNYDLKNLLYWLNANKISLNVKKTELVVFKSKRKQFDGEIKLRLSRKTLFLTDSVKYLGVKNNGNLSWKSHVDYLSVKLSRSNALLFKIRNFATCHFTRKALRIINFQPRNYHSSLLFKRSFILKFSDKVTLENTLFVSKSINNLILLFLMTDSCFHLINTIMKRLGLPLAIFIAFLQN